MTSCLVRYSGFSLKDFCELEEQFYPNQSIYTKRAFSSALRRIELSYGDKLENLNLEFLSNVDLVEKKLIEKDYKLNSIISTISCLIKTLKILDAPLSITDAYLKKLNTLMSTRIENEKKQQMTEREAENWVEWNVLENKVEEEALKYIDNNNIDFATFKDFLCLSLFVLETPVRLGNYINCKVVSNHDNLNDKYNYLVINNDSYEFIFNKYKTAKTLGKIKKKVNCEILKKLLDTYFEKYNTEKQIFLISSNKKPITQAGLMNCLKKITKKLFNKEFSVNLIRHSYISHFLNTDPSLIDKIQIAREMGQKYKITQQDLYRRLY